jgi:hypothetical protein
MMIVCTEELRYTPRAMDDLRVRNGIKLTIKR